VRRISSTRTTPARLVLFLPAAVASFWPEWQASPVPQPNQITLKIASEQWMDQPRNYPGQLRVVVGIRGVHHRSPLVHAG
jgi:hypothetical protein